MHEEHFTKILNLKLEGVMFHDEMADVFAFLNLKGFMKLHKKQMFDELEETCKIKKYYLGHYHKMLKANPNSNINVYPVSWVGHSNMEIDAATIKNYTKNMLEQYLKWEESVKKELSGIADEFYSKHQMEDFNMVYELIKDVNQEIIFIQDIMLKLKMTDYDSHDIVHMQKKICHILEEDDD